MGEESTGVELHVCRQELREDSLDPGVRGINLNHKLLLGIWVDKYKGISKHLFQKRKSS